MAGVREATCPWHPDPFSRRSADPRGRLGRGRLFSTEQQHRRPSSRAISSKASRWSAATAPASMPTYWTELWFRVLPDDEAGARRGRGRRARPGPLGRQGDDFFGTVPAVGGAAAGADDRRGEDDGGLALPTAVEETMADIAVVFGWRSADMDPMPLDELMRWHVKACRRGSDPEPDDERPERFGHREAHESRRRRRARGRARPSGRPRSYRDARPRRGTYRDRHGHRRRQRD